MTNFCETGEVLPGWPAFAGHDNLNAILPDPDQLMCLQRQSPLRMDEAVLRRGARVGIALGIVHRLQEEVVEKKPRVTLRRCARLRIDQFQFVAARELQFRARLGTDAYPFDACRR